MEKIYLNIFITIWFQNSVKTAIIGLMKIFFTTPFKGKPKYQKFIDEVLNSIDSYGAMVVSPEKVEQYKKAITVEKIEQHGGKGLAHYEFIRQGIATSDAVVIEASYENFRVGHEATLALMYGKPVLVLSQTTDYSEYINHERLVGKKYKSIKDLKKIIYDYLETIENLIKEEPYQTIGEVVDLQHSASLSKLRFKALQGKTYFSDWARRAVIEPDKVYKEIIEKLGDLPIQQPWDVFAKIYNEDTPDSVFIGAAKFADKVLRTNRIGRSDQLLDVACGSGAVSRILTSFGYRNVIAFDKSRAMLAEAYRLCSHMTSIKILESEIAKIKLTSQVKGMVWFDFSSNFALEETELQRWLLNLIGNLAQGGVLIFDVRTKAGWNIDFFKQKVTAYETDNFQRLWINIPDYEKQQITFDIFIRTKDRNGEWLPWEREQMTERMWSLNEVRDIVKKLDSVESQGIYKDDFALLKEGEAEPGLAYFVLKKVR